MHILEFGLEIILPAVIPLLEIYIKIFFKTTTLQMILKMEQ